jgi:hypothetical protein
MPEHFPILLVCLTDRDDHAHTDKAGRIRESEAVRGSGEAAPALPKQRPTCHGGQRCPPWRVVRNDPACYGWLAHV